MSNDIKNVDRIPNIYGDNISIKISEAVPFYCLGGPALAVITVKYTPNEHIIELDSYHRWITTHFKITSSKKNRQPLEGITHAMKILIQKHFDPKKLIITGSSIRNAKDKDFWEEVLKSKRHGPLEVRTFL